MANATVYIQKANEETWGKIPNKSDFLNKVLVELEKEMIEAAKNNGDKNETTTNPETKTNSKTK